MRSVHFVADIDVSILTPSDEPVWQAYVNSHPDATVYHSLEWRDILYTEYGFEPIYLIAGEGGKVVGVLPMFLVKNLRGKRLVSLPFSIYGGPLAETDSVVEALLNKCIAMVNSGEVGHVEIKPFGKIDFADKLGFETIEWGAGCIMDLGGGKEALWDGFAERFNVAKGAKKGLCFVLTDGERLEEFYRLQLMTRKRLGLPTPRLGYYASFFDKLPGMAKLAIVEKDGKAIAGDIFFAYRDSILLVLNVSDWEYRNCKPNDFMIWNIIDWACGSGFKRLDHGPVPIEEKGLMYFKKKWGGEMVKASRYYYPYVIKDAAKIRGSGLFRAMPMKIAGMIGSKVIRVLG